MNQSRAQPTAPSGIPTQAFVTTSKVVGSPDPPLPYRPVRALSESQARLSDRRSTAFRAAINSDHRPGQALRPRRRSPHQGRSGCRKTPRSSGHPRRAARPTASAFIRDLPTTAISTSAGTAPSIDSDAEDERMRHALHDGPRRRSRSIPNRRSTSSRGNRTAITAAICASASTACSTSPPATAPATPTRTSAART